MFEVIVAPNR